MKKLLFIAFFAALLCSCGSRVKLNGEVAAAPDTPVYLEQVGVGAEADIVVDSTRTDAKCRFAFDVKLPEGRPTLYNLRSKNQQITLLLSPKERVSVTIIPGIIEGYSVRGSHESELIKEIKDILVLGSVRLDSIRNAYSVIQNNPSVRREIARAYTDEYYKIKRAHIAFIVQNASSLAAVYALNQRLVGDDQLFNGQNDIVYYRMVADSVATRYPDSPYLTGLRAAIARYDQTNELADKLSSGLAEPISFPELNIADMYGRKQSLLALEGKVILLDFWSVADQNAAFHNADLKTLYADYHSNGFEIYQVSVDTSKPAWIETVQAQKLPWISVNDFRGADSPAVKSYRVESVPANFVIDRGGNIVGRNLFGDELRQAIQKQLK